MIDDINNFKIQLNNALSYYSLPLSADDIIIYEEITDEEDYEDGDEYGEEYGEEDIEDYEEDQQLGYGF
tara:strand:- start:198 stop:404 length:207 start_codon:yes stop_codon:yes gene_type:complete